MDESKTAGQASACEWTVRGMDCGACAGKVRAAVARLPGVEAVEVTVMSERLRLQLDERRTSRAAVEAVVRALGYGITAPQAARKAFVLPGVDLRVAAECGGEPEAEGVPEADPVPEAEMTPEAAPKDPSWWQTAKGRHLLATGALLALAQAASLALPASLAPYAFAAACLLGLAPVALRAVTAARLGQPFTIESLMTLAATGALTIGAAEEAAVVVMLFALGELLEGVAANRARGGIRALAALVPKTALLETGSGLRRVAAEALVPGQIVLVRPGERLPADGMIVEGLSGIDESPVTGESLPVTRGPGAAVMAGTIATEAALRIRVNRAAADNTIARILRLVEEAEAARAPTERFIDRFSRWYMPAVVGLAALVMVVPPLAFAADWPVWIYRGLSLLLIGCPCALVISVPAAIASALAAGARRGILLKGGAVIEAAAAVRQVAFDKTGTLTLGRPEVTQVVALAGNSEATVLAVAAAVERGSAHPLAKAIVAQADRAQADGTALPVLAAEAARVLPGRGAEALVAGVLTLVASPRHCAERGPLAREAIAQAERLEASGQTVVMVMQGGETLGLIALADAPRADAEAALHQIRGMGLGAVMLTGDTPRAAAPLANRLGLELRAGLRPEEKLEAVRQMAAQGGVMMLGDGINDAPALKQASVGVAMGSGTDVALEAADAALLRDRVSDVAAMLRLARATMTNIRANVAIALGLKALFLVTSVFGVTGLWAAIMADTGATVLVTLNALRLLRFDPDKA